MPAVGLIGCLVLAVALPFSSVIGGTGVLAAGALLYALRRCRGSQR